MHLSESKARQPHRDDPLAPAPEAPGGADHHAPDGEPGAGASWPLTAVAAVFLLIGVSAAMQSAGGAGGGFRLNLAVLAFPIGVGLLRRRAGWHTAALLGLGVSVLALLAAAVAQGFGVGQMTIWTSWGGPWRPEERWAGVLVAGLMATFFASMLYVLLRPATRMRFRDRDPHRPWIEWAALAGLLLVAVFL
jgi:hypothetical protein